VTPAPPTPRPNGLPRSPRVIARALAALLALAACLLAGGCATVQPPPLGVHELAEAQTFPFFRVYWVGPRFEGYPLVTADSLNDYISTVGSSVDYGNCVSGKSSALSGSGCVLPLTITTLLYTRRPNAPLGPQRNTVLHGVPAVIYDGGRSIELYSGRLAIDISAESPAAGLRAAGALHPINATGSPTDPLPPPVFCPGLTPARPPALRALMLALPGHPCQKVARTLAIDRALFGKG
jgi:hypothetical protein